MTAEGATDGTGSGVKEYMYFVDNKAGASDTIVRKTVGTDANPNVASFTANMGRYLGQVAVVDKAGNVSNVQGDPDARTKMWVYNIHLNNYEYYNANITINREDGWATAVGFGDKFTYVAPVLQCNGYYMLSKGPKFSNTVGKSIAIPLYYINSAGKFIIISTMSWSEKVINVISYYEVTPTCFQANYLGADRYTLNYQKLFFAVRPPLCLDLGTKVGTIYGNSNLSKDYGWLGNNYIYNLRGLE